MINQYNGRAVTGGDADGSPTVITSQARSGHTIRAGVYPRWASVLLIVSIPVTMFLDPTPGKFQESIGQILLGISVATLGWYALRNSSREATGDMR